MSYLSNKSNNFRIYCIKVQFKIIMKKSTQHSTLSAKAYRLKYIYIHNTPNKKSNTPYICLHPRQLPMPTRLKTRRERQQQHRTAVYISPNQHPPQKQPSSSSHQQRRQKTQRNIETCESRSPFQLRGIESAPICHSEEKNKRASRRRFISVQTTRSAGFTFQKSRFNCT